MINLDSDDELVPEALKVFWDTWKKIPHIDKAKYREVVAQCKDESGKRVGQPFPQNINQLPWDKARKICYESGEEHVVCFVANKFIPGTRGCNLYDGEYSVAKVGSNILCVLH